MTSCVCPACGFAGALVVFTNDTQARHFAALMGRVPPELSEALMRYLAMFTPAKHKLTWTRGRRLLEQLVPDIERRAVERSKRLWPVTHPQWLEGFEQMHEKRTSLTLPLKSHGYLYEVLAGASNKTEAAAESATEQARRTGSTPAPVAVDADTREGQVKHLVGVIANRFTEARTRGRSKTLEEIADTYRDTYDRAVVDSALGRLKTRFQKEQA